MALRESPAAWVERRGFSGYDGPPESRDEGADENKPDEPAPPEPAPAAAAAGVTDRQRAVLGQMGNEPLAVEALIERTALPAQVVLQELTFLTLKGRVRRVDGQTFLRR